MALETIRQRPLNVYEQVARTVRLTAARLRPESRPLRAFWATGYLLPFALVRS